MSDKRVLTISAIVLVAVILGMSSVAIILPQATAHPNNPGSHPKWWDMPCPFTGNAQFCPVWIDLDHSGDCSSGDNVIMMAKKAIDATGIPRCP